MGGVGAAPPVWAHLPVIVNEARQKLSKRRDKVALEDILAEGYLPGALVNYLMLLGWGPRDGAEIRPYAELEALFRLEDVSKAPAFFDVKKLAAFNDGFVRALSVDEFAGACQRWLEAPYAPWAPEQFDASVFRAVAGLAQTRLTVLSEITTYVDWLFLEHPPVDEASWGRAMKPGAEGILASVRTSWAAAGLGRGRRSGAGLAAAAAEHGLGLAKAQAPARVAVTGRTVGPAAVRAGRAARPRAHAGPDRRRGGQAGRTGPGSSLTRRPLAKHGVQRHLPRAGEGYPIGV